MKKKKRDETEDEKRERRRRDWLISPSAKENCQPPKMAAISRDNEMYASQTLPRSLSVFFSLSFLCIEYIFFYFILSAGRRRRRRRKEHVFWQYLSLPPSFLPPSFWRCCAVWNPRRRHQPKVFCFGGKKGGHWGCSIKQKKMHKED